MASTFYIDTNRQNSTHKTKDFNNQWTYKLADAIQIPEGTEIGIEQVFIHKQGISGSTIEIIEDIDETLWMSYYVSDNPHFVPKTAAGKYSRSADITKDRAYIPSFAPFGPLQNNPQNNLFQGGDDAIDPAYSKAYPDGSEVPAQVMEAVVSFNNGAGYFNHPTPSQRVAMFEDDTEGNPRLAGSEFNQLNDPYLMGYSENPMMAIFVDGDDTYQTGPGDLTFGAEIATEVGDTTLPDPRLKPFVNSVDIHIPKGVYSIGEIADIIENQINGKYVNIKNDDYYTDDIMDRQNKRTFDGNINESNIYVRAEAFDRCGGFDAVDGGVLGGSLPDENDGSGENNGAPSQRLRDVLSSANAYFATAGAPGGPRGPNVAEYNNTTGPKRENPNMYPNRNPSGSVQIGSPFNDRYSMPYYPPDLLSTVDFIDSNGASQQAQFPTMLLAYNKFRVGSNYYNQTDTDLLPLYRQWCKGRHPRLPSKKHLLYVPVHHFNQMIKLYKYNDAASPSDKPGTARAGQNSYLVQTGNWTVNSKRQYRYGIQTRMMNFSPSVCDSNGQDQGANTAVIGLHCFNKTNSQADIVIAGNPVVANSNVVIAVSPTNYQYDVFKQGYFVGTPDFSLSYDDTSSSYSIKGLHQSKRIPSSDFRGNPMTNEGQEVVYVRRTAEQFRERMTAPGRSIAREASASQAYRDSFARGGGAAGFQRKVENCLNNNEDRLGGVAIYNWAYQTALKFGDVNPKTHRTPDGNGNMVKTFDEQYQYLWKYEDYFSSKKLAMEAWETTIWAKLGFSYDNLQNSDSWETAPYYDMPVGEFSNFVDRGADATTMAQQIAANFYKETRSNMFFANEDFIVYGKTTKGDVGVDSIPTISTTFNNSLYQYTPDPSKAEDPTKNTALHTIVRTYNNTNISTPNSVSLGGNNLPRSSWYATYQNDKLISTNQFMTHGLLATTPTPGYKDPAGPDSRGATDGDVEKAYPNAFATDFSYENSMYNGKTRTPILTSSKSILAGGLPKLSSQGYYLITSDLVDGFQDDVKQGAPLPLMGIVPISNLSNQDFISAQNDITHITQQAKTINSITVKILNPDLTAPKLLENSSVIFRITMPLPQNTKQQSNQTSNKEIKGNSQQPKPNDDKTKSGAVP